MYRSDSIKYTIGHHILCQRLHRVLHFPQPFYIFLFFRYYQIVQFKLNGTLVTPLSFDYAFIILIFVCFVNTFQQFHYILYTLTMNRYVFITN